jgi:ABC-type nitrate/sulfonate/bicarbonate transport system ATPase subunit
VNASTRVGGAQLRINGVGKRFQARDRVVNALEATNLTVADSEFVTLVGPSGCGKSTLLNIISGLHRKGQFCSMAIESRASIAVLVTSPSRTIYSRGARCAKTSRFRSS